MPTRFYFPASTAADVSPVFTGPWDNTASAGRYKLAQTKGSSAITTGSTISAPSGGNGGLDRQYISDPMSAGITFTSGSTTVKGQLMTREYNNGDNLDRLIMLVKIVSQDGNTLRATVWNKNIYGTAEEFINNATHRNNTIANLDVATASYTTVQGETTDGAGWIEFSNTITFSNSYTMTATTQGFTFSGTAANLKKGFLIAAATTNFVFSGTNSTFNKGFKVTADTTAFNLTGQTTGLRATRKITADNSTYVLSGTANSLEKGFKVSADNGVFNLTGQDTSLEQGRKVSADNGSFVLSGTDATLIYTEAGEYVITADNGSYLLNGTSSSLEVGRKVSTDSGAFVFTGQDVTLTYEQSGGYTMPTNSGTFSFSGTNTSLLYKRIFEAGNGSYVMTGTPVTLTKASESTIGMVKIKFGYSVRANPNYNKYKR
jgi:hypothetical protein